MRSAARNNRSVIGSVEQRASTSPLAEVRYSGRPIRRCGNTMSIMKLAVCSMSSTASRSPPSEIRGTLAVAVRPTGFARRSSILFLSLAPGVRGLKLVEHDTDQLALGSAEGGDDVFHAVVDVEIGRQDRDKAVGDIDQLAAGGSAGQRRSVEDHEIVAAGGARLRDRLADGIARLGVGTLGVGRLGRRQDRDAVCGVDDAGSFAADAEPAETARLALAGATDLA